MTTQQKTGQCARICVVGSSNIDLTFRTQRLPESGETLAGRTFHLGYGGKGANQAVMAAKLGARVSMISRVGSDVFGDGLLQNYRSLGVDPTHVFRHEEISTGVAAIVVDDAARNCILVVPGANMALTPADVHEAEAAIQSADVLLCQLEVPVETTLEAFRVAKAAGVRTILNPAPAAPLPEELLRLADLCVPNETEIEALTGLRAATLPEATSAARALLEKGSEIVVVTLDDRGALVVDGKHVEHVPALSVTALDPTGAGDAFIGSLGVFMAEGAPLVEAARRANAVAALSVTRLGAQSSFPLRKELGVALTGSMGIDR
jgi:ribokinase